MSTWQYEPVSVSAVALLSHKSLEVQEQIQSGQRIQRSPHPRSYSTYPPLLTECTTDAILDDSPFFSADSLCRQAAASLARETSAVAGKKL